MLRHSFLISGLLFLGACATIIDKPTQDIRVETPGAKDSVCFLENDYARYRVHPPQTIKITKFDKPFAVNCMASGNRDKSVDIDPELSQSVYYNVANAVIPGVVTDYATRSMYESPTLVVVDFTNMKPHLHPLPDYQLDILQNPNLFQYEEFRTGRPALQSDRNEEPYELEKRDRSVSLIQGGGIQNAETSGNQENSDSSSSSSASSSSSSAASGRGNDGESADSMTRSMNPQIFYGGAENGAGSEPTNLR